MMIVRSPHGLLHWVRDDRRDGDAYTLCGRILENGWSRPRPLRNAGDPHQCAMCVSLKTTGRPPDAEA